MGLAVLLWYTEYAFFLFRVLYEMCTCKTQHWTKATAAKSALLKCKLIIMMSFKQKMYVHRCRKKDFILYNGWNVCWPDLKGDRIHQIFKYTPTNSMGAIVPTLHQHLFGFLAFFWGGVVFFSGHTQDVFTLHLHKLNHSGMHEPH